MVATTRLSIWNPLRTFQFRLGLLEPPGESPTTPTIRSREAERTFLSAPPTQPAAIGFRETYIAGVQRVSGLNVTVGASEMWEGGNALHRYANPDRATWDPITLEQGLAVDATLEGWAESALTFLRTGRPGDAPVKRNVVLDVWDPHVHLAGPGGGSVAESASTRVRRYLIFNAWISRYRAVPQLDAMSNEVALLEVELTHEGWRKETPTGFREPVGRPTAARPSQVEPAV